MKPHRHHKNPLLRYFCPQCYRAFRPRDIVEVDTAAHSSYHVRLEKCAEFQKLLSECEELDCARTCGEEDFADILDEIWNSRQKFLPAFSQLPLAERPVQQLDKETGNLLATFPSIMKAARQTGIARSSIVACCRGVRNSAGGFVWKYA